MAARKMLPNASCFTATPKNKTLEIFGEAFPADSQTNTGRSIATPYYDAINSSEWP